MNAERRLKPYDIDERDTNVKGYSDSNTREDMENNEQILNLMTAKETNQLKEAKENLNEQVLNEQVPNLMTAKETD